MRIGYPLPVSYTHLYDLRALLVYGLLTLALILSLWLVMRALGQQPVLVRSAALAGGDWVTVTDSDLRYTLSLSLIHI